MEIIFIPGMAGKDNRDPITLPQLYPQRPDKHRMVHMDAVERLILKCPRDLRRKYRRVHHAVVHFLSPRPISDDILQSRLILPADSFSLLFCISVMRGKNRYVMSEPDQLLSLSLH